MNTATKQELADFLNSKLNRNLTMYFENCQRCGLCAENCQYYKISGDPKMIPAYKAQQVRKLYKDANGGSRIPLLWSKHHQPLENTDLEALVNVVYGSCTMCRRCTISCPMGVDIAMIMRAARGMLTLARMAPKGLQDTVDIHLQTGNNMGLDNEEFVETVKWMEEELQDDLGDPNATIPIDKAGAKHLWVLNPREVKFYPLLLKAQAKIFYAAGEDYTLSSRAWDVTNYALFNGDDQAARTIAGFVLAEADRLGAKTIICTECGHGFRALKYLAPIWLKRNDFQVRAYVDVVNEYIQQGRIKIDPSVNKEKVTYHDPCNQARNGGFIEQPRIILKNSVRDFVELTPHGRNNWCCGGGGGALTMSEFRNRRLEISKIKADQISKSGAKIVATSCHNCIDQIAELNRHYKLGIEVKNTCELTADALVMRTASSATAINVDEQGYLREPCSWNENIAQCIADELRVGKLTAEHNKVIGYVKQYHSHYGSCPIPGRILHDTGIDPRRIFPAGPETVFKVAGLPYSDKCLNWDALKLPDYQ